MSKQVYKTANLPADFYDEVQRQAQETKGTLGLRNLSVAQMLEIAWRRYMKTAEGVNDET